MSCRILRFPALRAHLPGERKAAFPWAVRLWPGLPASYGDLTAMPRVRGLPPVEIPAPSGPWWHPETYPWTEAEAARRLEDEARLRDAFARGGEEASLAAADAAVRERETRQAQRLLLWCWLQEERVAELAALSAACTRAGGTIGAALGLDTSEELDGLPPEMRAPLAVDTSLLPDWRRVLQAAVPFLPEGVTLLAEGAMRDDLRDAFDTEIHPLEKAGAPGARILRDTVGEDAARLGLLRQPLWRLAGGPRARQGLPPWSWEADVLLPLPE